MTDARLWHPWLCINRVLRVMLQTRWSAEAWSVVKIESHAGARAAERDSARGPNVCDRRRRRTIVTSRSFRQRDGDFGSFKLPG